MAEILPNSVNDVASRGVTNETLAQFKGLARQVVINVDDGFRPVIMDGLTFGGKFKCASTDELEAVKAKADSAASADSVQWKGVEGVPENVKNALSFISQSLTPEQKAQVVQNLVGTFLPLTGGTLTGNIVFDSSKDSVEIGFPYSDASGALLAFRSKNYSSAQGGFDLIAKSGSSVKQLSGRIDGGLRWDNLEIERVNAIGEYFIRYESGLQICWGTVTIPTNLKHTEVLLPLPCKDGSHLPLGIYTDAANGNGIIVTTNTLGQPNKFTIMCAAFDGQHAWDKVCYWLDIGRWK